MPLSKIDTAALGSAAGNLTIGNSSGEPYGGKLSLTNSGQATAFFWNLGVASAHVGVGVGSSNLKLYNTYATGLIASGKGIDIDTEGRVLMPYQPSFRMRNSTAPNPGAAGLIPWDIADHNIGGHFNTGLSRFTAPVLGVYLITCMVYAYSTDQNGLYLRLNGSPKTESFHNRNDGGSYISHEIATTLRMNPGDYVDLVWTAGQYHLNTTYSFFAGHLLG